MNLVLGIDLGPIWGCGAFGKHTLKSTIKTFGEHHPIKLGVVLLVLKALLAKVQIWCF